MKPEEWLPGSVDAIATASADGRRIVIKAVNYLPERSTLLVRLQGKSVPEKAVATSHTINAGLTDSASLEHLRHFRLRQAIRRFTRRASSTCTAVRTCSGVALPRLTRLSCRPLRHERGGV
jgi:hypothetical protein